MPGLHLVCEFEGNSPLTEAEELSRLDRMLHHAGYDRRMLFCTQGCWIGWTGYRNYPLASLHAGRQRIYLEGKIYGETETSIQKELTALANALREDGPRRHNRISRWLLNTDGDFIIVLVDEQTDCIWVWNDALGRLPIYYRSTPSGIVVSRELAFIADSARKLQFDRMAIAQYLLLGYPLAQRTLIDGAQRLAPASLIKIDRRMATVATHRLHEFDFDALEFGRSADGEARELVELFSGACRSRGEAAPESAGTAKNIVGLSGGFDSRSVAACLQAADIPFYAVTRVDQRREGEADALRARELAHALMLNWKAVGIQQPDGNDLIRLLDIKGGMNYLGMAFILPFLDRIRAEYGEDITYFTGDGGDKVLPDITPISAIRNLKDLVKYLIARNEVLSLKLAADLTKVGQREIVGEIESILASYPEKSLAQKYVHFLIGERAVKSLFEGEDRNRSYFWVVAPFWSTPFFTSAMRCPPARKHNFALYRRFLLLLSPAASSVPHAVWNVAISDNKYLLYLFYRSLLNRVPAVVRRSVRRVVRQNRSDLYATCLHDQIVSCPGLSKYLDADELAHILAQKRCTKTEVRTLLTITSMIERWEGAQGTTLSRYQQSVFA